MCGSEGARKPAKIVRPIVAEVKVVKIGKPFATEDPQAAKIGKPFAIEEQKEAKIGKPYLAPCAPPGTYPPAPSSPGDDKMWRCHGATNQELIDNLQSPSRPPNFLCLPSFLPSWIS